MPLSKKLTIGQRRLHHLGVSGSTFKDAADAVAWLGAMQGQDYSGSLWALALRVPGTTAADIEKAIVDATIMRTWAVRGTLHYVAPADIHWMLALLAPRLIAGNASRYKQLELDAPTLQRSTDLIARAVTDRGQLSRAELFALLEASNISTAGQRGFHMLQRAGLERLVYQGPMLRNETTFRALPSGGMLEKEVALAQLASRYFVSHGPATLEDFTHWSGLTVVEARAGLDGCKATLQTEQMDGQRFFSSAHAAAPPDRALYLLPGFDEFILGYRDRSAVLDAEFADAICPGGNGVFTPSIVLNGRVVGTWRRTIKARTVEIACSPFMALGVRERRLFAEELERFGRFVGLPVTFSQT